MVEIWFPFWHNVLAICRVIIPAKSTTESKLSISISISIENTSQPSRLLQQSYQHISVPFQSDILATASRELRKRRNLEAEQQFVFPDSSLAFLYQLFTDLYLLYIAQFHFLERIQSLALASAISLPVALSFPLRLSIPLCSSPFRLLHPIRRNRTLFTMASPPLAPNPFPTSQALVSDSAITAATSTTLGASRTDSLVGSTIPRKRLRREAYRREQERGHASDAERKGKEGQERGAVVGLPRKRFYRQRAHANPFSDHFLT